MKKKTRKLSLHRETLRRLGTHDMRRVLGGTDDTSALCIAPTGCECETNGCVNPTMDHTCGTVCDIPSWHC